MAEQLTDQDPLLNLDKETAKGALARNEKIGLFEAQGAHRWGIPPDHVTMFVDLKRCIGCFSCETSCKLEHDLPVGPRFIRVMQVGPKKVGKHTKMLFYPMACFHCGQAPCVPPCPTGAISKRAKDGIVWIDPAKCIGCKQCIQACPFGAIQFDTRTRKAIKCDYCIHRVDKGLQPACVTKCSTHCLYFGDLNQIMTYMRDKTALKLATSYLNGADTETLSGPAYVWPEKQQFIPRIRLKPGKLQAKITKITPQVTVKVAAKK